MSQDQQDASPASDGHPAERPVVVRHRQHRFPARSRVVKVRYDEQEYAALAAAAGRAQLTPSGYLALAGLASAGTVQRHRSRPTGSCSPSCWCCGQ